MRRSVSLESGAGGLWQVKGYLGVDAALRAAARPFASDGGWLPAQVPGSVLDDVWHAGEVPDPYVERNSLAAEWVPERAWLYRRRFDGAPAEPGERAWLRFEGVDHGASIYLDGALVGRHEGMFVPFELDVSGRVGPGEHVLAVVVDPAPESEPQVGRTSRVRIHKSRMTYGWDFCPRMVHQGIWQPVAIVRAGWARVVDVWARPLLAPDLRSARLDVEIRIDAAHGGPMTAEIALVGAVSAAATIQADAPPGQSTISASLDVADPPLWWPNGLGEPALHRLVVRLSDAAGTLDERSVPVGFRTVALRPNEGGPPGARAYTWVVNGTPVCVNGWNWVPLDAMYGVPRLARLEHLMRLAQAANVNLLRIWGGGLIETRAFYEACDRLGLMVWQEFSQSSSGVESEPSRDPQFVELMRREAEAIVPLRRNHPSLAAWCGGNELEKAGGGPLDECDSPVLGALGEVVGRLDPDRAWFPTSPSGPRFHNRLDEIAADPDGLHDVHGPWEHQGLAEHHGLWDRGTSLFNSEFGVEGMTNRRSHEALIKPENRWPATRDNPAYRHLGDWWINEPLVQAAFGGRLHDLESLRRASQFLQAEGLRYAVEANRRRWPRNSGSIPWQFNESYPNAWCTAAVDHRGDPKPAYHAVRRAYAPTVVCAEFPSPALAGSNVLPFQVWAWGTGGRSMAMWRIVDIDGSCNEETGEDVELSDGRPTRVGLPEVLELARVGPLFILDLWLQQAGRRVATNRYLLSVSGDFRALLELMPARLDIRPMPGGIHVAHRGGPAAMGVRIEDDRAIDAPGWAEIADDGFDLLPGESRSIAVRWADAPAQGRRLRVSAWNVTAVTVDD